MVAVAVVVAAAVAVAVVVAVAVAVEVAVAVVAVVSVPSKVDLVGVPRENPPLAWIAAGKRSPSRTAATKDFRKASARFSARPLPAPLRVKMPSLCSIPASLSWP